MIDAACVKGADSPTDGVVYSLWPYGLALGVRLKSRSAKSRHERSSTRPSFPSSVRRIPLTLVPAGRVTSQPPDCAGGIATGCHALTSAGSDVVAEIFSDRNVPTTWID